MSREKETRGESPYMLVFRVLDKEKAKAPKTTWEVEKRPGVSKRQKRKIFMYLLQHQAECHLGQMRWKLDLNLVFVFFF